MLAFGGRVAGGELEAWVVFAGRGRGAERERDLHRRGGLVGDVANRRLVAQLIRVGLVALVRRQGVTAGDFEAAVEDGAVDDFRGRLRNTFEAGAAVEARKVDEREHGVGVQLVKNEGSGAVQLGGVDQAVLRVAFFQGHVADGATGIGEVHFNETVAQRGDLGGGRVGARGGERGVDRRCGGRRGRGVGCSRAGIAGGCAGWGAGGGRRARWGRRSRLLHPKHEGDGCGDEGHADDGILFVHYEKVVKEGGA